MGIEYRKMSLFDAPKGSLIVHACNAQGVWGSGIAKDFKTRYPLAFEYYETDCQCRHPCGTADFVTIKEYKHEVGWLITSEGYGNTKSTEEEILIYTTIALAELFTILTSYEIDVVYSNKFNSGLFQVPWEKTEKILNTLLKKYPQVKWVVCDLNLNVDEQSSPSKN